MAATVHCKEKCYFVIEDMRGLRVEPPRIAMKTMLFALPTNVINALFYTKKVLDGHRGGSSRKNLGAHDVGDEGEEGGSGGFTSSKYF